MIQNTQSSASSSSVDASLADFIKKLAEARERVSYSGDEPTKQSGVDALRSANTAIFQMAQLGQRVRSLQSHASDLTESNQSGINAMRTHVADSLKSFNEIAKTAGLDVDDKPIDLSKASLKELQTTLGSMRESLQENISKLGASVKKSLGPGSHLFDEASASQATAAAVSAISSDPLAAFRAQMFGLRSGTSLQ